MPYAPEQARNILSFIDESIEWFILGGPADACEAQYISARFPNIKVIGFEPNPLSYRYQLEHNFPGKLLSNALWSSSGQLLKLCSASVNSRDPYLSERSSSLFSSGSNKYEVISITVDEADRLYGPFNNAILWIDIEHAEAHCLIGAARLLYTKQLKAINIEIFQSEAQNINTITSLFGYKEVYRWGEQQLSQPMWNAVYVPA